jgi:hypothetical protein
MQIREYLALALLVLSLPAAADFSTVTQAYEVGLSDLRLPGNAHGTLAFKECSDCTPQAIRVNSNTRYVLNGRTVTLATFRSSVKDMRGGRDVAATVLHHLETNVITGVRVRLR